MNASLDMNWNLGVKQLAGAVGMNIRLIVFFVFQTTRLSMSQLALLFDNLNLVFTPLASKLERNADDDALINEMHVLAAASNAPGESTPVGDALEHGSAVGKQDRLFPIIARRRTDGNENGRNWGTDKRYETLDRR